MYDLLIIGAGPIGLACGIEAKKAGLSYIIIEKGVLTNSLFNYPLFMTFFSTSERLEIGGVPFMSVNAKPNRNEALEYYRRVKQSLHLNVRLFEEVIDSTLDVDSRYTIRTNKAEYNAKNIIVATGFYDVPVMMNVPGEQLSKVTHYYKEPHFYSFQKVLVVGANNSAADAALETWRKGADVTLVIRGEGVGRVKYWAKPDLENRIQEGSIKAYFNSTVTNIQEQIVEIATPGGLITIDNDFVIAMTGYMPNFSLLKKLGVNLTGADKCYPEYNPDTMETTQKGIYLAGVVCGGLDTHKWFIENSIVHAEMILRDILGKMD